MIVFTNHAKDKLSKEVTKMGITKQTIKKILMNPDEMLYDAMMNRFVAASWSHKIAVIYEKTDDKLTVVTVIYSSKLKDIVTRRRQTGRWI